MNILITGSCGFLASNFIRKAAYNKLNYKICGIDKVTNQNSISNIYENRNNSFYIGNILDEHFLSVVFKHEKPELVIHMAAETSIEDSFNDFSRYYDNNTSGTQKILQACVNNNIKKIIYISSLDVYKENNILYPNNESDDCIQKSPYAITKFLGEDLVRLYSEKYNLNHNILRVCSFFGPRQFSDKLIPRSISSILNGNNINLSLDGNNVRNWLHVADVVNALLKVIECGESCEVYNTASSRDISDVRLVGELLKCAGLGSERITFDANDKRFYRVCTGDSSKLKSLGWTQGINFEDGIQMTFDWYKNNPWWFKTP